ncbi:DNA sulfur modification protein DndB [Streptomyces sp. DSM 118148]|uniref:DNA sulfur modification protein DndB n=1 Tax=Streptomyces sp. DSM 118148 TaxID=3448667 RepID=UPI00403FEF5E
MPTAAVSGVPLIVQPFRQGSVVGVIDLPTLLSLVPNPKREEDRRVMKTATSEERRHAEVRALVQRMIKSTQKGKNVGAYASYLAAGTAGEYRNGWSHPPITLWAPDDADGESVRVDPTELIPGTGLCRVTVLTGTPVVAIDGETQITAWHEVYDNPETFHLTRKQLRDVRIPFELYWGLTVGEARQIFFDRNVRGVPVAKNLAMSMDQRDLGTQIAHDVADSLIVNHNGEKVLFSTLVQSRKRQLSASDPEVITLSGLRALIVTTMLGRTGLTLTSSAVTDDDVPDGYTVDDVRTEVTVIVSRAIETLFPYFAARSAVSTPAVLAGLGIALNRAMKWYGEEGLTDEQVLSLLTGIRWERKATYWDGIAGKGTGEGDAMSFAGGVKDSGGRVADAILDPTSSHGRKIRGLPDTQ